MSVKGERKEGREREEERRAELKRRIMEEDEEEEKEEVKAPKISFSRQVWHLHLHALVIISV